MHYDERGRLTEARQTYFNSSAPGQGDLADQVTQHNLYDLRRADLSRPLTDNSFYGAKTAKTVEHSYNNLDQVEETIEYFTPGQYLFNWKNQEKGDVVGSGSFYGQGSIRQIQGFSYNADGQTENIATYGLAYGTYNPQETNIFKARFPLAYKRDDMVHISDTEYSYQRNDIFNTGLIESIEVTQHQRQQGQSSGSPSSFTQTYDYSYEGRDSYLEKSVLGTGTTSANGSFNTGSTISRYDEQGNRVSVIEYARDRLGDISVGNNNNAASYYFL